MITPPVTICFLASDTPICAKPVCKVWMINTPRNELITLPRPPIKLVPPMTHAAIAANSIPTPALGSTVDNRDVWLNPANAHITPLIANTAIE